MNTVIQNIIALVLGISAGVVVNMGLVNLGPSIIPLPTGTDASNMDSLKESMKSFSPLNFLFPFLAHAMGTLVGAFVVAKLAISHQIQLALVIGVLFLIGGIMMVKMVGGPLWFIIIDLVVAYIPMAYLGTKLARLNK